jgi:hypothetical protein
VQQYACLAQHVGSAEAVASTLLGTNETANKTAENTVANILESPGLMAQPTSTCTDWETDTSSFLDWVWLRKSKQSQPLNLKTNVPNNQRVGADQRNRLAESDRFSLPNDP